MPSLDFKAIICVFLSCFVCYQAARLSSALKTMYRFGTGHRSVSVCCVCVCVYGGGG